MLRVMEAQLATLLAATSCSWRVTSLAVAPPLVSVQSNKSELFNVDVAPLTLVSHNLETDRRGCAAKARCFLSLLCLLLCVYAPPDFSPPVFLQLFSVSARISFSLLFFDKQPGACSLPIHFIHILFPCKNFCLLGLGSASSQHKQLLRIRSDYPTDQKSRRVQAAPLALALAALASGSGAGLTSRSRPAFQPSCSRQANSAPSVAIFSLSPDESPARGTQPLLFFFFNPGSDFFFLFTARHKTLRIRTGGAN